jgi:putative nucleotidyltransferase with HDIG domain
MTIWTVPHAPAPPDWWVDWDAIAGRFAWIQALAGVPQEPAYHAEGDVLTHTRMVAEALAATEAWRALPQTERDLLFAAALLHDVAKPDYTRIDPDGRVASPGHARAGAVLAHYLLWTGAGLDGPAPFPWRHAVAGLVRHHGLPLWFYEKDDPRRAVVAAAQIARLDHVALLAEADVRGRVCADQLELLDRIALFRAYCEEVGCSAAPYPFASDHSRFLYFSSPPGAQPDPARAAYDDTVCKVVLLSGLPGAGKDTWVAAHHADWPVISLDGIRRELRISPSADQGAVAHEARARARDLLRRRVSFIWNATNVTRALRAQLIALFAAYHARISIVYLDAPYDALLARNRTRPHPVPEAVIDRLARRLEVPDTTEAHAVEWINEP